jgi:adenylate kinase family enzyme
MAGCRIVVVGTTGSGKTTTAAEIARRLGLPHIEIDALNWGPNWTPSPAEALCQRIGERTCGEAWVIDGNYSTAREIVWNRADTIVWLDLHFLIVMGRLLYRTLHRVITREELWGTNRESWRSQFLSRDSLFLWAIKTHWRRRRQYAELLARPQYAHLHVVRLRSPRAVRAWLEALSPGL